MQRKLLSETELYNTILLSYIDFCVKKYAHCNRLLVQTKLVLIGTLCIYD